MMAGTVCFVAMIVLPRLSITLHGRPDHVTARRGRSVATHKLGRRRNLGGNDRLVDSPRPDDRPSAPAERHFGICSLNRQRYFWLYDEMRGFRSGCHWRAARRSRSLSSEYASPCAAALRYQKVAACKSDRDPF